MDIEGLGPAAVAALIDADLINDVADLFSLDAQAVAALERQGKKSAENLITSINASKTRGMAKLLVALGIRQVGEAAAKELARQFPSIDALAEVGAEMLTAIRDVGPVTAQYLADYFSDEHSKQLLERLKASGVEFTSDAQPTDNRLLGQTWALTGALNRYTRDEAKAKLEELGAKVSGSVSKKTSVVLAGDNVGSKLDKARELGVRIIGEDEFEKLFK
jgi:DNA ligase (NAD+)